jgi:hypothetical protein
MTTHPSYDPRPLRSGMTTARLIGTALLVASASGALLTAIALSRGTLAGGLLPV